MKNISLSTKLWIPTAVLIAVLMGLSIGAAWFTNERQAAVNTEQAIQQNRLMLANRWMVLTQLNATQTLTYVLSNDITVTDAIKPDAEATVAQMASIQKLMESDTQSAEERRTLDTITGQQQAYSAALAKAMKMKAATMQSEMEQQMKEVARPAMAALLKAQEELVAQQEQRARQLRSNAGTERLQMAWAVIGVFAFVSLLLCLRNLTLQSTLSRPLKQVVNAARAMGNGDLTQRLDTSRNDEIGEVLRALSRMSESLSRMVDGVRLGASSITTASAEIASGNQDLSARTEQTASNLQVAASSMEQLTGTVKQSADSARQANQLASSAAEVAARGGTVVSQVVSTMEEINASSKKIADIIGVIDGIAFQTNILALNAAVEAARAGEQGRGFAVVAGEVRSLAQRSAAAAKEIKSLIGASVEKVDSGSRLVADAGQTMQEIVNSVQRVTDIIGEITAASTEQSDGIGQVSASVVQLDQMTQQNAALVEQSAAAAESLKDQANKLAQVVSAFRVERKPQAASHS